MRDNFLKNSTAVTALALLCLAVANPASAQPPPAPPPSNAFLTGDPAALPPDIDPASPLGEVVKLTQAGVDESVILTYVTNSGNLFNLDSNKIIYLQDIGVPSNIVTAMMQHDQGLMQQMAAAPPQPPPPTEQPPQTPPEAPALPPDETTPVTVNYFYTTLAPYGSWVQVPDYGWCWQPTVVVANSTWQPYCDHGHWVYSDCGWYWISDYSWGWATFHYGRWFHHPHFGWCWWPDTAWAPSWVCWRYSDDYCGWAPLPPFTGYVGGVGLAFRGAAVGVDFTFGLGVGDFVFVSTRDFCDPRPRRHRIESGESERVFNRTTIINHFDFDHQRGAIINHGIPPQNIAAVTHKGIQPVAIRDAGGPLVNGGHREQLAHGGRELVVARPRFEENSVPGRTSGDRDFTPHFNPAHANANVVRPTVTHGNQNMFAPNAGRPTQSNNNFGPQNRDLRVTQPLPSQPQPQHFGNPTLNNPAPQNQISRPVFGQPNPNANPWPQTSYTDDKHIASPHGQQFEDQTPHSYHPNVSQPANNPPPAQPQPPVESRATYYAPPAQSAGQSQSSQPASSGAAPSRGH